MTGTLIKVVRKNENGYEDVNGMEILCKSDNIGEWLNEWYGETGSKDATDFHNLFWGNKVTWEYDEEENTYFSKYEDGTITGEAFKVIGIKEW